MAALIPLILQSLPTITTGVEHLIAWLHTAREAGAQTGEWKPEYDALFLDALKAKAKTSAFQPDSK